MADISNTILKINNASESEFSYLFNNIVEYYPNITKYLYEKRPYKKLWELIENAMNFMDDLSLEDKEYILKLHPDLAGKLADEGKLTNQSKKEQSAAGLDAMTLKEKQNLTDLNKQYKDKFEFPFVICARENTYLSIKNTLQNRLTNTKEDEVKTGFEEVKKIAKLRLMDVIRE